MLTRITDRKIPCVYIRAYEKIKNWGRGPYNSLRHADNRKYFSGLSLTRNRREALMFYLAREVGIFGHALAEKKVILMINEFKYGQTWKIWPSPLSLSLYSTFKASDPLKPCNESNTYLYCDYYLITKVASFTENLCWVSYNGEKW